MPAQAWIPQAEILPRLLPMYMERGGGLCATFFVWFVADLVQGGLLLGWVPAFDSGSPLDTLGHLPAFLMLLAVVSRS
jgi:hypothetical protein